LENISRPGFSALRPYFLALNERYQPANLIAGKIGERVLHYTTGLAQALLPQKNTIETTSLSSNESELWAKQLATHKAEYQMLPTPYELDRQIGKLKACVDDLENRGCRCVFIEMPIDSSLANLPLPALIRSRVHSAFPSHVWVQPKKGFSYATVDGLHLAGPQAEAYAMHICTVLREEGVFEKVH
jgi:hypothetical protein